MKEHLEGKLDQAAGRVKEAAGRMIGDDGLELEGKLQRIGGELAETGSALKQKAVRKVNEVIDKLERETRD